MKCRHVKYCKCHHRRNHNIKFRVLHVHQKVWSLLRGSRIGVLWAMKTLLHNEAHWPIKPCECNIVLLSSLLDIGIQSNYLFCVWLMVHNNAASCSTPLLLVCKRLSDRLTDCLYLHRYSCTLIRCGQNDAAYDT